MKFFLLLLNLIFIENCFSLSRVIHYDRIFAINLPDKQSGNVKPPPYKETARMARFIVHNSDWTSMATISNREGIKGYPFANVFSVSDGSTLKDSSGIPYLYLTPLEVSVKDLKVNNKASLTMTLAQGTYCNRRNLDSQDPRCARVILTGKVVDVPKNSTEEVFAKKALFSRHPDMPSWPKDHGFYFGKLDIEDILVLDFFGGIKTVSRKEYLEATPY